MHELPALSRRQLLALAAPLFIRDARAADVPRFTMGVASGQPRPDRLVLWTRLTGIDLPDSVHVQWELAHDEAFQRIAARGTESAEQAWAHSVHAEPGGLAPDRWYFYRFSALGQRSAVGRTRTAPAADAPAKLRYSIASCQRWDHGHYAAWAHMARQEQDLVLFLGDYIYEYGSPANALRLHDGPLLRTLAQYRDRYAQYKSDPALQAAHAACPWLLVWDDHEVENDYANQRGQTLQGEAMLQLRSAAYQAYWEHQPFPKAWRPNGPDMRIYERYDWGRLARIHALDDRQYRDPQACIPAWRSGGATTVQARDCPELQDSRRTLLGAAQERWLDEGWDAQRPWNLLAQQTLMARASSRAVGGPDSGSDTSRDTGRYWTDGWDGYAPARRRLLASAVDRRVPNLVVLGGDVHAHYVADLKTDFDDAKSPVMASEFCGSSISSHGAAQSRVDEILKHNLHLHYGRSDQRGYIAFTLDERRLDAQLMVVAQPQDAASPVQVAARFSVEAGRPGPQRA
ncbi:alkaline phosphatase D family protein [Aquabacterium sp.]|uniref:alkaline phosphatase D family protein n=1 Tax=Aquabacterium sp. TaxID=1872578 RepID=UPI002C782F9C|nr:alkaline phosphatase D family protein [Aquabacterium sp.]HSW06579.1 alkaline phosphatase D family protein [Aquabacterium sp.]